MKASFLEKRSKKLSLRFLGIGDSCDLGALYLRLQADGHAVKVFVGEVMCRGTLAGLVEHVADWRAELAWIREVGADGIILFENVAAERGALQDELRRDGFRVVGGSAYGDRLENDRSHAQQILAEIGLATARVHEFTALSDGECFIAENPGRYVLKFNGPGYSANDNYVGQADDGRDVRAVLAARRRQKDAASYILMQRIYGVEMGVGAYFNGERFLTPACLDWEHKRFFAGELGELTGEMGTVVSYDRSEKFFDLTLRRMEPYLRAHRHVGYVNLNTIVNADGIWPLEFTCRFGYPGFAILGPLQTTPWAELFLAMVDGADLRFSTLPGFAVGIVLTTPPFPYTRKKIAEAVGLPVFLPESEDARRHLHFGEVGLDGTQLVTSGIHGWTMVATGVGATIRAAQEKAYGVARQVHAPNLRYRLDIGERLIATELAAVESLGLFDPAAIPG